MYFAFQFCALHQHKGFAETSRVASATPWAWAGQKVPPSVNHLAVIAHVPMRYVCTNIPAQHGSQQYSRMSTWGPLGSSPQSGLLPQRFDDLVMILGWFLCVAAVWIACGSCLRGSLLEHKYWAMCGLSFPGPNLQHSYVLCNMVVLYCPVQAKWFKPPNLRTPRSPGDTSFDRGNVTVNSWLLQLNHETWHHLWQFFQHYISTEELTCWDC